MRRSALLIIVVVLLVSVFVGGVVYQRLQGEDTFSLTRRPAGQKYLYDYAGILKDQQEYIDQFLRAIKDRYKVEAVIVSVSSMEEKMTIEELAVELFNNWEIGKDNGRGVLLLLLDETKEVKLEVSLELEDVFTDMFSGYIEDLQLRPYFLSGQVGIGLIAVMEELENRAQIKDLGDYTPGLIVELDDKLLSGGAGAKRDLAKYQKEEVAPVANGKYPAGRTPDEAWQTMIRRWKNKVNDPNLGVYTEVTKLAYRDFQNSSPSSLEKDYRTWGQRPYEIKQNANYAVVSFGKKKGWDNAPFLLSRTPEGWKFDIVHQRKYIRMGNAPKWGVERSDFPHMELLSGCPYWMGQDIPWEKEDIYSIKDDARIASEILRLEGKHKNNPDDFDTLVALGRLNTITSMRPNSIFPLLRKAKQLNPDSPLPYKYLAIANVSTTYQYEAAIREIKEFIKRDSQSVFGHNYLGYCYLSLDQYKKTIEAFNKAIRLDPDNAYAYCKLSRAYANLYLKAPTLDLSRNKYKDLSIEMYNKARSMTRWSNWSSRC